LREIELQYMCGAHPNVVNINDCFDNTLQRPGEAEPTRYLLLVMEFMSGGELFNRIKEKQHFHEHEAATVVREIASAIRHLHRHDVAHRDLKPENLLYTNTSEGAALKLSDFGFAKLDRGDLVTPVFTPYYVPPQILQAQGVQSEKKLGHLPPSTIFAYDKSCDMWSLGVILYILLCGYPPFASEIQTTQLSDRMKRKIANGEFTFHEKYWKSISDEAKAVVTGLLATDPSRRLSADQLLKHPWIVNNTGTTAVPPKDAVPLPTVKHLQPTEQTAEQAAAIEAANVQYRQQLQQMRRADVKAPPSDGAARETLRKRREKVAATGKKNPFFKKLEAKQVKGGGGAANEGAPASTSAADTSGAAPPVPAAATVVAPIVPTSAAAAAAASDLAEGTAMRQTRGSMALVKLLEKVGTVDSEVLAAEAMLTVAAMTADLASVKQAFMGAGVIGSSGGEVNVPMLVKRLTDVMYGESADSDAV
jgi:hypothetical protein